MANNRRWTLTGGWTDRTTVFACLLFSLVSVPAQPIDLHELAESLARSGDIVDMEQVYGDLLERDPKDIRARLGRATARSWQGMHADAQADFEDVLRVEPENLPALIGIGYDLAWEGRYESSRSYFRRALAVAPDNTGASKGIAFSYLWAGQPAEALPAFEGVTQQAPGDAEAYVGIGQAHLALGHAERAANAFEHAEGMAPERTDAVEGLKAAYGYPALVELNVWGGYTSSTDESGLRLVELASSVRPDWRVWARYDNSLTLDNPALARSGVESETYSVGTLFNLNRDLLMSLEAGYRDLPENENQTIVKGELIYLIEDQSIKLGTQVSPSSEGYTDLLLFTEYGFPVSRRWRLAPAFFYSRTGEAKDQEYRGVIDAGYVSPDRWKLNLGGAVGAVNSSTPGVSGGVYVARAELRIPFAKYHSVNLAVRYESNPTNDFTIGMVGLSFGWPRH